jgi:hypothetical protein
LGRGQNAGWVNNLGFVFFTLFCAISAVVSTGLGLGTWNEGNGDRNKDKWNLHIEEHTCLIVEQKMKRHLTIVPPFPSLLLTKLEGSGLGFALLYEKADASISRLGILSWLPARVYAKTNQRKDNKKKITNACYKESFYLNLWYFCGIKRRTRFSKDFGFSVYFESIHGWIIIQSSSVEIIWMLRIIQQKQSQTWWLNEANNC